MRLLFSDHPPQVRYAEKTKKQQKTSNHDQKMSKNTQTPKSKPKTIRTIKIYRRWTKVRPKLNQKTPGINQN